MIRHLARLSMPVALLLSLAAAQDTAPPVTQPGLATAPAVRKYEPPPANASAGDLEKTGDELRATRAFPDSLDYYRAAMAKASGKPEQAVLYNKMGIAELQQDLVGGGGALDAEDALLAQDRVRIPDHGPHTAAQGAHGQHIIRTFLHDAEARDRDYGCILVGRFFVDLRGAARAKGRKVKCTF